MRKYIPLKDILLYGGLATVAIICMIYVLITIEGRAVGEWIAILVTTVGSVGGTVAVFLMCYMSKPDFVTKQGTLVWHDRIGVVLAQVEDVLAFFITVLPTLKSEVTKKQLEDMLKDARIEWSRKKVSWVSRYGAVLDKAGLQKGKGVMVHYTGSLIESALFHELIHMVKEVVLKQDPDAKHEDKAWWKIVPTLKLLAEIVI